MSAPSFDLSKDDIVFLIDQFVFSRRDRNLIYDRLIDGFTIGELEIKYHLSNSQVKVIVKRARNIVFSHVDRLPKSDRK